MPGLRAWRRLSAAARGWRRKAAQPRTVAKLAGAALAIPGVASRCRAFVALERWTAAAAQPLVRRSANTCLLAHKQCETMQFVCPTQSKLQTPHAPSSQRPRCAQHSICMRAVPIVASVVGALLLRRGGGGASRTVAAPTARPPRRPAPRRVPQPDTAARNAALLRAAALLASLSALLSLTLVAALLRGQALRVLLWVACANACCAGAAAALCVNVHRLAARARVRAGPAPGGAAATPPQLSAAQLAALSATYSGCGALRRGCRTQRCLSRCSPPLRADAAAQLLDQGQLRL
jgi:hypothetical protein